MSTSKQLIVALEQSDWLDRLILASAMCFFFAVVLFILKQRIVDRGLSIVLWWTRFTPGLKGDKASSDMIGGRGTLSGLAVTLSTSASALATMQALVSDASPSPDTSATSYSPIVEENTSASHTLSTILEDALTTTSVRVQSESRVPQGKDEL